MEWGVNKSFRKVATFEDLVPVDKMKLLHAVNVMKLASECKKSENKKVYAMGIFLENTSYLYNAFHNNNDPINTR